LYLQSVVQVHNPGGVIFLNVDRTKPTCKRLLSFYRQRGFSACNTTPPPLVVQNMHQNIDTLQMKVEATA
jgi:acetolactate synthase regulatory subunit